MSGRRGVVGKKGAVALQTEVNTEADWLKLLEKEGLVVVDVYSSWCGPCVGMVANLKKLKIEISSEYFRLAVAKSDRIGALKRFVNKSEPTWMFIASGHMVNLMFGADAPRLRRLIGQELERETSVLRGERERQSIPFDELTQEEKRRLEETECMEEEDRQREAKKLKEKLDKIKIRNLTRFAKTLRDKTVVLYFPHTIDDQGTCETALKMLERYDQTPIAVHDQMEVQLTDKTLPDVFYSSDCSEARLPQGLLETLLAKPCLASLVVYKFRSKISQPFRLGLVEKKVGLFAYGHLSHTEPPATHSPAVDFRQTMENEEVWPGIWTPLTYLSKASAVKALLPHLLVTSGFREEQLPPPRYCVIIEASKAKEVNNIVEEYPDDILNTGYFDGVDPVTAKIVAKNLKQLEELGVEEIKQSKIVLAVTNKTIDPLLVFCQFSPVYVSMDTKIGDKDCDLFFPETDVLEGEVMSSGGQEADKGDEEGETEEGGEQEGEGEHPTEVEENLASPTLCDDKN